MSVSIHCIFGTFKMGMGDMDVVIAVIGNKRYFGNIYISNIFL